MRRYLSLIILIALAAGIAGWQIAHRARRAPAAQAGKPAQLQPTAPSVQAALAFLNAWSQGNGSAAYGALSAGMKKMTSEPDFAAMMAQRKFTNPQSVTHVETAQAAYVICSIQTKGTPKGEKPCAGFSLLLKKEADGWKVAQIQEEPKLFEKYADLRLSPGQAGGWTVTYQNEKGQVATLTLPEL